MDIIVKTPVLVGSRVLVQDQCGKFIEAYDAMQLAMNWFRMSNDCFYRLYGFNWVPKGKLFSDAQKRIEAVERERYENQLRGVNVPLPPNYLR